MKNNFVQFLIIFFLLGNKLSAQFRKIPVDSVPTSVIANAKILAFDYLNAVKPKDLTQFITDHGNMLWLKNYDFKLHKEHSKFLKDTCGNLVKINLEEILKDQKDNVTLRFKAYFDKIDDISEIRITTNNSFKFSDFEFIPWYFKQFLKTGQKLQFEKVDITALDSKYVKRASDFAEQTYKCNSDNLYKLTPENSARRLRQFYNKANLILACEQWYDQCGDLIQLELSEVITDSYRYIYRFQAEYQFIEELMEVIVITHPNHKLLTTLLVGTWREEYEDLKIKKID